MAKFPVRIGYSRALACLIALASAGDAQQ